MLLPHEKPFLGIDARLINMSGIGTVCQNTIPYLLNNFKIILLGNPAELKKFDWVSGCEVISVTSNIYSVKEQIDLVLKVPNCDYFLSTHYNIPILPIRAKKRIVIIHDVNHIALKNSFSLVQKIYAKFVITKALELSDKVITVSEFSKSEIKKFFTFNDKKLFKIKLGVDRSLYKTYDSLILNDIKNKYQLPDNFILYVGNVKPHKNLSVLIKAYSHLKKTNKAGNYKLVIVGKKEGFITNENEIFNLISNRNLTDDVVFTGYVETTDLPKIYNLAALFVFPSLYEGFGLPPLEAMACGCPALVSSSSSLPEVCKDAALYFNPLAEEELSYKIAQVLNNFQLRSDLINKGLILVPQYNWEDTAKEITEIIKL